MKPTRSLHINTERTWRGGEKQTLALVEGLLAAGHAAELACPPRAPLADHAEERGITVHRLSMRGEADFLAVARLRRILRHGDFDICQMHTSHAHSLGVLARGWRKKPITIVNRRVDFSIHRRGMFGLNSIKYRYGVDRYIAISNAIRNVLIGDGLVGDNIDVVHSGVERLPPAAVERSALRGQYGLEGEHFVVGNVAHMSWHKGQIYLIQAVAELRPRFPHIRALIVGEGEKRPELESEIARLNLGDVVILAGFQNDVASHLRAFDMFVMPSVLEGLCTSILDAFHAEVPVVAADIGGIPEIVHHGETGLLARPRDASDFASKIASVMENPQESSERARRGKALVEREFSVEQMVKGTVEVYGRVLA